MDEVGYDSGTVMAPCKRHCTEQEATGASASFTAWVAARTIREKAALQAVKEEEGARYRELLGQLKEAQSKQDASVRLELLKQYASPLEYSNRVGTLWTRRVPLSYDANSVFATFLLAVGLLETSLETFVDPELWEELLGHIRVYNTEPHTNDSHLRTRILADYDTEITGRNVRYVGDTRNSLTPAPKECVNQRLEGPITITLSAESAHVPIRSRGIMRGHWNVANGFIVGDIMDCTIGPYSGMTMLTETIHGLWKFWYHGEGTLTVSEPPKRFSKSECKFSTETNSGLECIKFSGVWDQDLPVRGTATFLCGATFKGAWTKIAGGPHGTKCDGVGVWSGACRHSLNVGRSTAASFALHQAWALNMALRTFREGASDCLMDIE